MGFWAIAQYADIINRRQFHSDGIAGSRLLFVDRQIVKVWAVSKSKAGFAGKRAPISLEGVRIKGNFQKMAGLRVPLLQCTAMSRKTPNCGRLGRVLCTTGGGVALFKSLRQDW
jgi:hypothetical protein